MLPSFTSAHCSDHGAPHIAKIGGLDQSSCKRGLSSIILYGNHLKRLRPRRPSSFLFLCSGRDAREKLGCDLIGAATVV